MKFDIDYTLYFVTDRRLMSPLTIEQSTELAIEGGCTVIQLREKNISSKNFYETAVSMKKLTEKYNLPLIINDRVDIALSVDADGVHIGQDDLPLKEARKILGDNKIIGVSVSNALQAAEAIKGGADYLGVGPMYPTDTKHCTNFTTFKELENIVQLSNIPIVVIGGINKKTIPDFDNIPIDGIAVVSAIACQDDVKAAATELKNLLKKTSF